ncbi:MAG: hypothetical protein AAGA55_10005 [Planctomycetota bacterium]
MNLPVLPDCEYRARGGDCRLIAEIAGFLNKDERICRDMCSRWRGYQSARFHPASFAAKYFGHQWPGMMRKVYGYRDRQITLKVSDWYLELWGVVSHRYGDLVAVQMTGSALIEGREPGDADFMLIVPSADLAEVLRAEIEKDSVSDINGVGVDLIVQLQDAPAMTWRADPVNKVIHINSWLGEVIPPDGYDVVRETDDRMIDFLNRVGSLLEV